MTDRDIRAPVVEEELIAGKRQDEIGRVRPRKGAETEQQQVSDTVRQERQRRGRRRGVSESESARWGGSA